MAKNTHPPVVYSGQATVLLEEMPNFDRETFEVWWWDQQRSVGSQTILQYLLQLEQQRRMKAKLAK